MKKIILVTMLAPLFAASVALAHSGHGQNPGDIRVTHGGSALAGENVHLEYKISGSTLEIYPIPHDDKVKLTPESVTFKAMATPKPGNNPAYELKFERFNEGYKAPIDFKNGSRVEVKVTSTYEGKTETFKKPIQVEKK